MKGNVASNKTRLPNESIKGIAGIAQKKLMIPKPSDRRVTCVLYVSIAVELASLKIRLE